MEIAISGTKHLHSVVWYWYGTLHAETNPKVLCHLSSLPDMHRGWDQLMARLRTCHYFCLSPRATLVLHFCRFWSLEGCNLLFLKNSVDFWIIGKESSVSTGILASCDQYPPATCLTKSQSKGSIHSNTKGLDGLMYQIREYPQNDITRLTHSIFSFLTVHFNETQLKIFKTFYSPR